MKYVTQLWLVGLIAAAAARGLLLGLNALLGPHPFLSGIAVLGVYGTLYLAGTALLGMHETKRLLERLGLRRR
jgi:hypothetical protein